MLDFEVPQSRIEAIMQNMLGANNVLQLPQSRNEALLLQILNVLQHGEEPEPVDYVVVTSKDEMTDHDTIYLYNGTLWRWETRSVPHQEMGKAKACIVPASRYSHGSQAFVTSASSKQATIIIPVTSAGTSQTFELRDTAGVIEADTSYTGLYYGSTNSAFPNSGTRVKQTSFANATNIAAGRQYLCMMIKYTTGQTYETSVITVDGVELDLEVVADTTPTAAFGQETTVWEDAADFYDTGRTPRNEDEEDLEDAKDEAYCEWKDEYIDSLSEDELYAFLLKYYSHVWDDCDDMEPGEYEVEIPDGIIELATGKGA